MTKRLFDELEPQRNDPLAQLFLEFLNQLKRKRKLMRKTTNAIWIAKWRKTFDLMKVKDGLDPTQIERVLRYYIKKIGDPQYPKAFSAPSFRYSFARIERLFRDSATVEDLATVPEKVHVLASRLGRIWPKDSQSQLLETVFRTVENYKQFRKFLVVVAEDVVFANPRLSKFIERYLSWKLPTCEMHFAEHWMYDVNDLVWRWGEDWSGNLTALAFKVRAVHFQKVGRKLSMEYTGDTLLWDQLMQRWEYETKRA